MTCKTTFLAAAISLIISASAAEAQKAGTYSGTSEDGGGISITVTGTAGNFTLSNMNVNFQAHCTHPARTANEGWGFFLGQAIVNGDNNYHSSNDYYDIRGALHFPSDKKIVGNITSVTSVFVPGNDPPTKAQFCKSAKQGFSFRTPLAGTRRALHLYWRNA